MQETRSTKCPDFENPNPHIPPQDVWSHAIEKAFTCEEGPLDGELGGDLVDHVVGEVARDQARVLHQHEDRVRHLLQLTVRQI